MTESFGSPSDRSTAVQFRDYLKARKTGLTFSWLPRRCNCCPDRARYLAHGQPLCAKCLMTLMVGGLERTIGRLESVRAELSGS